MDNKKWLILPDIEDIFSRYVSIVVDYLSGKLSEYNKPILIIGDSGTGKGLFLEAARQIMEDVSNCNSNYFRVNCASFDKELAESKLFGYVKGAFTGASNSMKGMVASANKGLLILDEIGELPLEVQAKLLIFIEEGRYRPVGSVEDYEADVKIIGTTNKTKEFFRDDFWYRFYPIFVPSLYERRIDVIYYIAYKYPDVYRRLTGQHLLGLFVHNWPGNIREIDRVIAIMKFEDSFRSRVHDFNIRRGLDVQTNKRLFFTKDDRQSSLANIWTHKFYEDLIDSNFPVKILNSIIGKFGLEFPEQILPYDVLEMMDDVVEYNEFSSLSVNDKSFVENKLLRTVKDSLQNRFKGGYSLASKIEVGIMPYNDLYEFKNIYKFKRDLYINQADSCFEAVCMLFLKDRRSKESIFDNENNSATKNEWSESFELQIMKIFYECDLIRRAIEFAVDSCINIMYEFDFRISWHEYIMNIVSENEIYIDDPNVSDRNVFDSTEKELFFKYYSYLLQKYRTVRDASKHAGVNESTFRNKLRQFGLLPCQRKNASDESNV